MTPQQPEPGTDQPLTPEQEEFLRQRTVQQTMESPTPASDQAAVAAQMTERGPVLPAETAMDELMAALRDQSEQIKALQAQVGTMQKQQADALAATGGPMITRYAEGARDKIAAHAVANPDTPLGHFKPLAELAGNLVDEADALAQGSGALTRVEDAAGKVTRWITRTHARLSGKHIDWSAVLDDVETVVDEAIKLAA